MEITKYNNYEYRPGKRNIYTPADLADIAKADAEIEAWYTRFFASVEQRRSPKSVLNHREKCRMRYYTEREKRLAYAAEYRKAHRDEINARRRAMRADPEYATKKRAYDREYYHKTRSRKATEN
jgi:hypothetical protein